MGKGVTMSQGRARVRLSKRHVRIWKPRWDPEIKGWSFNYIRKNKWRYEHTNDYEDLMQDAYLVFLKVCEAYPRVIDPPHFMSLYKTSLRNALSDKAREYERKLGLIDEGVSFDPLDPSSQKSAGEVYGEGPLLALLNSGPPELKLLVNLLKDDTSLEELRKPQRAAKGEPRLNFDQRVSKFLGIDSFPFRQTLKQLLSA